MRNPDDIRRELFSMADPDYKAFQSKLMPTVATENIIGIRTPILRKYASGLADEERMDFLSSLPHTYYEENNLHAFLIEKIGELDVLLKTLDEFLPYVDNWATCGSMNPKLFAKHRKELLPVIYGYLSSEHTYTVRYGIGLLMRHFLGDFFKAEYADRVASITHEDYYVKMMVAWYFATALAHNYEDVIPYLEQRRLAPETHRKAIQKALESFRISKEQKEYLKKLR